jgi:hypothetical protein
MCPAAPCTHFLYMSQPKSQEGQQNIHLTHGVRIVNINNPCSKRPSFSQRKKQTHRSPCQLAPNVSNSRSLVLLQEQHQSRSGRKKDLKNSLSGSQLSVMFIGNRHLLCFHHLHFGSKYLKISLPIFSTQSVLRVPYNSV